MARYIIRLTPKTVQTDPDREARKVVPGDVISIKNNDEECGADVLLSEWIAKHGSPDGFNSQFIVLQVMGVSKRASRPLLRPAFKNHPTEIDPDTGQPTRIVRWHRLWILRYLQFRNSLSKPLANQLEHMRYLQIHRDLVFPYIQRKSDGAIFDPD